ncbi:MAG: pentapeptide repeat-containing protein [Solirubrobacterales bacterium]
MKPSIMHHARVQPSKNSITTAPNTSRFHLQADCGNCFGLCCVALYFSASDGFPAEKEAGLPCANLQPDYRCAVYKELLNKGLKGCTAFECFGAGQMVSQVSFGGRDWRESQEAAALMFAVFLAMRQLHEMIWYLTDALERKAASPLSDALHDLCSETERLTRLRSEELLKQDIGAHRDNVNQLLLQTSELVRADARLGRAAGSERRRHPGKRADLCGRDLRNDDLRGADLRGAYLIAADLREMDLCGTDFIGADFRDTDLRGADLSKSLFLTQAQVNTARGDQSTKLPGALKRPAHWLVKAPRSQSSD